jgi:two-component system sensor histidine kinase HydH
MNRRTLLIVDDNRALAENLGEILEEAGYRVRLAASCAEALAQDVGFCVALVDVRLPDGDGIALATQFKERLPDSEVILLTGFATLESATAAVRSGAWAYLIKPCSPDDLLLAVRQAVRQVTHSEERRQLARRALVAEKLAAVGTLAAGLSHEIRNPLNAASLQLTLLERRLRRLPAENQPSLLEPLSLVQQEINRLKSILEDFLAFARPRELNLLPIDLTEVAREVVDLFAAQAEQAGLRLERGFAAVGPVDGDAGRLQQALTNLVLNAIQATPAGGWVRVEVGELAGEAFLAVEDSGPGISQKVHPHLFEPFFTTKEGGSGLGLPLVHAVVQQHAGSISLEEGRAGGARFVIKLPLGLRT